jgi:Mrp family chromosome partitioning ATPase
VSNLFGPRSLLILDLPPVLSCGYGELAARLAEAVLLVVRAGQTPASLVAETCARLEQVPLRGIVLNRQVSRIPRWLQQLL